MKKLSKWFLNLVLVSPLVLFFSYYPLIKLGENESMYFELSLPLIWLVLFDAVTVVLLYKKKLLFKDFKRWWVYVLFPIWCIFTLIWSLNVVRGVLTVGVLWLVLFAGYSIWRLRELFDKKFGRKFWKWFFGSTLVVCIWCVIQCILDLIGVSQDYSLMCNGCTSQMFGFPHPNGFAIEPQFMGNLLLAPVIMAAWFSIKKLDKRMMLCFFSIAIVLFLTFSRGAIYAFFTGLVVITVIEIWQGKKWQKKKMKRLGLVWGMTVVSFLFTLNLQGLMAQVSPTNDTYLTGVTKVLNHLSLGVIDVRDGGTKGTSGGGKLVENSEGKVVEELVENEAVFDGYVTESTDTRLRLSGAAMKVWSSGFKNVMVGVGLGGAGQALYSNGLSPAPREIVQNEYASLLLETGLIGVYLLGFLVILMFRLIKSSSLRVGLIGLFVAYAVTLVFFSGLPNALHIYLLPVLLAVIPYICSRPDKK